jgi:hypothetical protein
MVLGKGALCITANLAADCPDRVIRVALTGSKASPNVRYAFNSDGICASQRTDAKGQYRP